MTKPSEPGELSRAYNPSEIESRWYDWWYDQGYFTPKIDPDKKPFVIVMPPPNVTGELHVGHALFVAVEDILTRWHRMMGEPALWLPGADHAGIAGQWVVERQIATRGLSRHDLGREAFLDEVWEWMDQYRGRIREQLRTLGASCDWTRFLFTMDPQSARAVRVAFKHLYDKGLIYRGERMINWCPRCMTALSDLEVNDIEVPSHLWTLRYPMESGQGYIEVATTRPETMLGDTGVAVHPDDPRYRSLIGQMLILPIVGRRIPIVADDSVDPEFGSGAVKVTPAHDFNDFDIGQRHGLPSINILNLDGTLNENAGEFAGQTREGARVNVVARLEREGALVKVDEYVHNVGHCDRCGTILEPIISLQWWISMQPLAQPAAQVVRDDTIRMIPERFKGIYLHWMENIRDWCISRQLWWGHRIPVWYCKSCGEISVTDEETLDRCQHCGSADIEQDPDVLDTWFSSGLWTFSTLGWPEDTADLRYFYPGTVMETGYDIIFLWVARMIFFGLEFMGEAPFFDVYFHGTVRDEAGQRMSKTKGNVIDPTEVTKTLGSDPLRFSLITAGAAGSDLKLSLQRVESNRNFGNKIWQATRFVLRNIEGAPIEVESNGTISRPNAAAGSLADRWIVSRLESVTREVSGLLADFQLGEAGRRLYDFLWGEYCDWYIEASKVVLNGADQAAADITRQSLAYVLERSLRLLHPFMPFLTEELWQHLPHQGESIMVAPWPVSGEVGDERSESEFAFLMEAVRSIRNARAESGVEPARWIAAIIEPGSHAATFKAEEPVFRALARLDADRISYLDAGADRPENAVALVVDDAVISLPLAGMVDLSAERARLSGEIEEAMAEQARIQELLANDKFVSRAPDAVVQKQRDRLAAVADRLSLLRARLDELSEA